jgi:hypothetical protein
MPIETDIANLEKRVRDASDGLEELANTTAHELDVIKDLLDRQHDLLHRIVDLGQAVDDFIRDSEPFVQS